MTPGARLGLAAGVAALVWDPSALAADPKRAAIAALALAVVVRAFAARSHLGLSTPLALFAAFTALSMVSLAWGSIAALGDLATWTAAIAVAMAIPEEDAVASTRWAAVVVGTGAALIALVSWSGGARGVAVHGGMGNANWLGLLLAVTTILTIDVARSERLAWAAVAVQGAAAFVAESRVGWVATCAGLLAWAFAGRARAGSIAVALSILATVGIATVWPASGALAGRAHIWRASLDAAADHPLLGAGVGEFSRAFLDAQGAIARSSALDPASAARVFENATTAHHDLLQAAVETGAVGLALLALALALGADALRKRWPAAQGALVAAAVCASGDSPLRAPSFVLVLVLVLASARGNERLRSARPWAFASAAVAVGSALAVAAGTWIASRSLASARDSTPERGRALARRAVSACPWCAEAHFAESTVTGFERASELTAQVGTDVALGNALFEGGRPNEARTAYERALLRNPGSFRAHANLALAATSLGDMGAAVRHLAAARALYPGHPKLAEIGERIAERVRDDAVAPAGVAE